MLKAWTTRPLSLFGSAGLLVALAAAAYELMTTPVWAPPLTCAGVIFLYTGARVSRNEEGWADALAAAVRTAQGVGPAGSARTARAIGGGWALFGVLLIVVAVAGL